MVGLSSDMNAMSMLPQDGAHAGEGSPRSVRADRVMRVGVLVNPSSGRNRSGINSFLRVLAQHGHAFCREVETPGDVDVALKEMAAKEVGPPPRNVSEKR